MLVGDAASSHLYSEVGQGTTVKIYLPRHHGKPDQSEEVHPRPKLPRAEGSETALVVDDEPTIRMLIGATLTVDLATKPLNSVMPRPA